MREHEVEEVIRDGISKTPIGKKVELSFKGLPVPIDISLTFAGGWVVSYTLIPGKSLEFIRGEDGYLDGIAIVMQPYDGLK